MSPRSPEMSLNDQTCTIEQLRELMKAFVTERKWWKYHNPKNLAISVSLEAAELLEHFQWIDQDQVSFDPKTLTEIEEEMSDIFAYLFSLSHILNIDIAKAFQRKMKKNAVKYPPEKFQGTWEKP